MTFFRQRIFRPPVLFSNLGVISVSVYLLDATPEYISLTYNDGRNERISIDRYKLSLDLGRYIATEEEADKIIQGKKDAELKKRATPRYIAIFEDLRKTFDPRSKNHDVESIYSCLDKTIQTVQLKNDDLAITFTDGCVLVIGDMPRCCEKRYMAIDDNLDDYQDAKFLGVVIKKIGQDGKRETDTCYEHDISFVEIKTSKGPITIAMHNEHNGSYSGINLVARLTNQKLSTC